MNIFQILVEKVSATITVILISFGLQTAPQIEPIVVTPVQEVIVATTTPEIVTVVRATSTPVVTKTITPVKVSTTTVTSTPIVQATTTPVVATTTPVVETPVVVPVQTLQTNNQVAPTVAPQVIIQIQQPVTPEAPVASAPIQMETTYKLKNGDTVLQANATEQEVRTFAEGLNSQINWRKQVRVIPMKDLTEALNLNGYTLTEN